MSVAVPTADAPAPGLAPPSGGATGGLAARWAAFAAPAAGGLTVIEPRTGWRAADWRELVAYQDLFVFLVWRGLRARYAQSGFGLGWAVLQPLVMVCVYTMIFGKAMKVMGDGGPPYPLWVVCGLLPWRFFAKAVSSGANTLSSNANLISKVYFPRLVLPLAAVVGQFPVLLAISAMTAIFMAWFGYAPTRYMFAAPLILAVVLAAAVGVSCWATALSVQFRDINHGSQFAIRMLMYSGPVVYPIDKIDPHWHRLWALNPVVGVVESVRAACGVRPDMPWDLFGIGAAVSLGLLVSGVLFFVRRERLFADVA